MANSYRNIRMILNAVIAEIKNQSVMIPNVDRQLDKEGEFRRKGDTIYVRRPNKYEAQDGPDMTGKITEIQEAEAPVTLDVHKSIAFNLTQKELALNITDPALREQHIMPAANSLTQAIESEIARKYYQVANFFGTPGTTPGSTPGVRGSREVGEAMIKMKNESVEMMDINGFYDPNATLFIGDSLTTVFNEAIVKRGVEKAAFLRAANVTGLESNSIANHTVGNYTGSTPLVNGAAQDVTYESSKDTISQTIITDGWTASITGVLNRGDVIQFDGVNALQARTYEDLGRLRDFTVLDVVDSDGAGNATITISPAIVTTGDYRNVSAAPADNAPITVVSGAPNSVHPQNMIWQRRACTLATARLQAPDATVSNSVTMDGITLTFAGGGDILKYETVRRLDILFGVKFQLPEWAVRHTG